LYEYCPKEIFDRPKSGFAMPIKHWLRGPLKLYTQELLSQDSLSKTPMINSDYVQMLMKEHLSGEEDRSAILWNILMFVSWRDKYQKFIQE
jgi:asparagine synthase (glutamine-hydrolysing)